MFRVCLTKRSSAINYGSACLSLTALAIILTLFGCATSRATGELRRYAREQLQEVPTCVIGIYLWDDGAIGDVGNYAQQAGFRRGDKILSYDNTSFVNREAFVAWLEQYQGGGRGFVNCPARTRNTETQSAMLGPATQGLATDS